MSATEEAVTASRAAVMGEIEGMVSLVRERGTFEAAAVDRTLHNLSLHSPTSPAIGAAMDGIRVAAKAVAVAIHLVCPASRERSLALTALEESTMWAIAAIARNQEEMTGE